MRPAHIARELGISRGTVYRFLPTTALEPDGALPPESALLHSATTDADPS
ncbi:hypothetical protein ACVOMT_21525 (plasmid) [Sphingomonas panni]